MSDYLFIDTSSGYLTVAAVKGGKKEVRYIENCAMKHSVILMDEIDAAFGAAGLTPGGCDFFGAVTGPGSFTGIRIGISTAKGLAAGAGKPVMGLTSFELLAYNVDSDDFCVAIDAAHSSFYVQRFGKTPFPPAYMGMDEVESIGCPVYGFGDLPFSRYFKLNPADCICAAAERGKIIPPEKLAALYVRRPQAEEKLG